MNTLENWSRQVSVRANAVAGKTVARMRVGALGDAGAMQVELESLSSQSITFKFRTVALDSMDLAAPPGQTQPVAINRYVNAPDPTNARSDLTVEGSATHTVAPLGRILRLVEPTTTFIEVYVSAGSGEFILTAKTRSTVDIHSLDREDSVSPTNAPDDWQA